MAITSGHGATLTLTTLSTWTPAHTSINPHGYERPKLDTSTLATTGARTCIGGDLYDISPLSATFLVDTAQFATGEDNCFDDFLFSSGAVAPADTATATYPGGADFTESAFAMSLEQEELTTDTIIAASISLQFQDAPAYSNAGV